MSIYKIIKYRHRINFDGQCVPLSMFPNKKDLIEKIVTITISDKTKEQIDVDEPNMINKHSQHIYATRREEIFAKIIKVYHGCKVKAQIITNPFSNNNSNVVFFVHNTRSTPYYEHSDYISTLIHDGVTMNSDLLYYFRHTGSITEYETYENDDRNWIDQSLFNRIDKNPTQKDLNLLNKLLKKNVISQDLYDKYVNDYIPLSHIRETILDIIYIRNSPRYETYSYCAPLDKYQDCIFKSYASYGHDNNYTESRYFKEDDFIDIILENIHYYPLDINNMNDYREYDYKFGQIPVPMAWSGGLFEDRDSILSSLKVGNVVRCQFKKLMINNNKECCGGGAWYFAIIQINDDTVYGLLKDFYYDPKEYNLNEGDIFIFNKNNITEIPHLWPENSNLKDFKTLNTGYFPKGCVCKFDDDPKDKDICTLS